MALQQRQLNSPGLSKSGPSHGKNVVNAPAYFPLGLWSCILLTDKRKF
jgi:hypothetical protein